MKKFIEDDIGLSFNSPVHFVQSVACMLLTAPYKLVMTISAKVLYLPKDAILKVLLHSVFISMLITVINAAFQIYIGRFSMFRGKLPVIVMVVTTALLAGCYFAISVTDLDMYTQLSDIFPREIPPEERVEEQKEQAGEQVQAEGQVGEPEEQVVQPKEQAAQPEEQVVQPKDFFKEEVNGVAVDKYVWEPVVTSEKLEKVHAAANRNLNGSEYSEFVERLEGLTDPSKFISEDLITRYANSRVVADEINLEVLNTGIIPNDFKALA